MNDDLYRRQEDQRWREKIEERLSSLTTDTMVIQDRLDEAEERVKILDLSVRGDASKETGGLIERLHDLEGKLSRLWAVIFMDAAGQHGIYDEFKRIQSNERKSALSLELHWKFYTAMVVAICSTIGLLLTNWDKILKHFPKEPAPIVKKIKRIKPPVVLQEQIQP